MAVSIATPYTEGRSIDIDFYCNEAKVMAYVKDRQLVDVGSIDGEQLELAKTLVKLTNLAYEEVEYLTNIVSKELYVYIKNKK